MGRTIGSAELGRELRDSFGPLIVGSVATVATLGAGLSVLGGAVALVAGVTAVALRGRRG